MPLSADQIRDRLRDYASEFSELCRSNANREQLLNGASGKHGLNHITELVMMLPSIGSGEFQIRE